jgi:hypothetical protein
MTPDAFILDQLDKYGNAASLTEGTSMRPFLKSRRDTVVLEPLSGEGLKRLDVVLYRSGDKLIMHRIIRLCHSRGILVIRGDNTYKNEYVPESEIIAKMTAFTRKGKCGNVTDPSYRLYSVLWTAIYPLRYPVYQLGRAVKRCFRAAFGRKNKK